MRNMRRTKKLLSLMLFGVLCFSAVIPAQADEISDAKKKQQELEAQMKQAEQEKNQLSSQLNTVIADMQKTQEELDAKQQEIQTAQDELDAARIKENQQYEDMKIRIKYMYENGNTGFLEVLFTARSIGDFLNKAEYIHEVTEYDRNMLKEFQKVVKEIEEKEAMLKEEEAKLAEMQASLSAKQEEVEKLLENKSLEMSNLESEIGNNAEKLKQLIARAEEAKRQLSAANNAGSGGTAGASQIIGNGQLAWPTTSNRVTSTFGYRVAPVAGATSYHDAIDIGVAEGSPVYAADGGKVITAAYGYNGGRGVYVMVDHGNGIVTRYQHLRSIYVSVGDTVQKGQNIAASGNTGASSGPHLDFAVIVNGTAVNPLSYL